ncbi:MAG: hypothetical protein WBL07_18440, partial [Thiothrix litoralis]|uniref:hypothetical protein n=1 Tax=Thiothrix litoralis TaxID=2891210 RepID=UPI003C72618C
GVGVGVGVELTALVAALQSPSQSQALNREAHKTMARTRPLVLITGISLGAKMSDIAIILIYSKQRNFSHND